MTTTDQDASNQLDATAIAHRIAAGETTAVAEVRKAISAIEDQNPTLNAVVATRFDRAIDEAEQIDRTPAAVRGPLAGVPFLAKDNNVFVDDMPTTYSCDALRDFRRGHESDIVRRWRKAGLVIVGKTNTPEHALTFTTEPTLRGPTRNPWSHDRTPGGSSGGSAAAVAAGWVPIAHANDAGGSIRIPASCCGLFGMKPTRGRVTLAPHDDAGWFGLNHEHVVTRSVRDSASMLRIHNTGGPELDEIDPSDVPSLSIAVSIESITQTPVDAAVETAFAEAITTMRELGHNIIERHVPAEIAEILAHVPILAGTSILSLLTEHSMTTGHPWREDQLEAATRTVVGAARAATATDLATAISSLTRAQAVMKDWFSDFDLFMSPTLATPPVELGVIQTDNDPFDFDATFAAMLGFGPFTMPFNASGFPAMSIPLSSSQAGLPIGIQIAGLPWSEPLLFAVARQLEQARPWSHRRPPLLEQH